MTSSSTIVLAARQGDPIASRALVDAHGGLVYGMCRRLCSDPDDAYQEIWAKVFEALGRFDPAGPAPLRGWIATIARRHLTDRHRRKQTRGTAVPVDGVASRSRSAEDLVDRQMHATHLEAALMKLPSEQREVVVQHHIHGVAVGELATQHGVAIGTIKSRLHRGRARLAELLRRAL